MFVIKEDKVSLVLLQPMTNTSASTIPNQVLRPRKDRKSSQTKFFKSTSLVPLLFTKSTMMVPYQTKFSSTEMV